MNEYAGGTEGLSQRETQGETGATDMKRTIWHAVIMTALLLTASAPGRSERKLVGRIIARVNGNIITNWQYDREEKRLHDSLAEEYSGAELESHYQAQKKDLLRDLIDQDLMVQKAKDEDINVDTDVVKRLDEIRKSMHLQTQADLQAAVEKQGLLWEDFEDNIRRHLLMSQLIGRWS